MITVLHPGIYSTIQDLGRKSYAHNGVPISGVMDAYSAKIGNQLLCNEPDNAVIEITFGGAKFQFEKETNICISGANFTPMIDSKPIVMHQVVKVEKGMILTFKKRKNGVRTYLCVLGGIQSEVVLQSRSFYKGITANSVLKKGDKLFIETNLLKPQITNAKIKLEVEHFTSKVIRCSKGPEFDLLSAREQEKLFHKIFTISNNNNRMGYQLDELLENQLEPILTSGVLPGTVQLTPSGKLIVLMRDCQVTGGYPRVLQITEEGVNRLSQKTTGDKFSFSIK